MLKSKASALLSSFDVISGSMFLCVCDAVVVLKGTIEDDEGEKEAVRILPESIGHGLQWIAVHLGQYFKEANSSLINNHVNCLLK